MHINEEICVVDDDDRLHVMCSVCVFGLQKKFLIIICIAIALAILALILGLSIGLSVR